MGDRRYAYLYLAAAAFRVAVFVCLGPNGSDHHYEVIEYILREHRLPDSSMFAQSHHPPLYALLALPFAAIGGARLVEFFSLALSLVNLWLFFVLIARFVTDARARLHAFALTALLPQFVIYGIVVSNDTLAMLVGTLALFAAERFAASPTVRNAAICGVVAGVGLSTKTTLLAHAAVLLVVVIVRATRKVPAIALFVVLTALLGSYKYVENQVDFGRPLVHNMDFGQQWVREQQPTITSAFSLVDINLGKLLSHPYAERRDGGWTNLHSMPLLFYATLWHGFVPVSNFRGVWMRTDRVAQVTYVLAIIPTLLIAAGFWIGRRNWIVVAMFVANLALVIAVGLRYDAWSCFQSRLLFPSFAAIALAYGWAIQRIGHRRAIDLATVPLYLSFVMYFAMELFFVAEKYV